MSSYIVVNNGPGLTTQFLIILAKQGWLVSSPADANHLRRQIVHRGPPVVIIYRASQLSDQEKTLILDLKKRGQTRLIAVVGNGEELPAEELLRQQVDDFLIWPASEAELTLRVHRLLPSEMIYPSSNGHAHGADYTPTRRMTKISEIEDDWHYRLSPVERRIVRQLQKAQGEVVPTEELLKYVTGESESMQINALRVYINRLRNKIQSMRLARASRIINVRGVGYRIEGS
jgi:DNA-binding response OmpR family regulator